MENIFIEALENLDKQALKQIPKSDRHNHGFLGGRRSYFLKQFGIKIENPPDKLNGLDGMHEWISSHFFPNFTGREGFERAYEAAFFAAKQDGVSILEMNIDVTHHSLYNGSVATLVSVLDEIHHRIAPNILFIPEIGFNRENDVKELLEWFEPYLDVEYFQSIDLYGNEFGQPIENFCTIYKIAKEKGIRRKAHVGEFGPADSIMEAIETLDLDAVQHGISAAESPEVITYLRERQIPLHICPTSNVRLGRVDNYSVHPIRKLFDQGVNVTINSDDIAIFDASVSDEYISLYQANVFTAAELNVIRMNGLQIE